MKYPYKSFFSPLCCPLILELPIETKLLILAVADELHSVASDLLTFCVLVDATFVVHKVFVDL